MLEAYQYLHGAERNQLMADVQEWAFARTAGNVIFLAALVKHGRSTSAEVAAELGAAFDSEAAVPEKAPWAIDQPGRRGE
jgi:hypothetical protein